MKIIDRFFVLSTRSQSEFTAKCREFVEEYQDKGLEVEIQFSTSYGEHQRDVVYAAMIIGRKQA